MAAEPGAPRAPAKGRGVPGQGPLPSALCPLPSAHCPLPAAPCPLPPAHCPLPPARCWPGAGAGAGAGRAEPGVGSGQAGAAAFGEPRTRSHAREGSWGPFPALRWLAGSSSWGVRGSRPRLWHLGPSPAGQQGVRDADCSLQPFAHK